MNKRQEETTTKLDTVLRGVVVSLLCTPGGVPTCNTPYKANHSNTERATKEKHREDKARHPPSQEVLYSYRRDTNESEGRKGKENRNTTAPYSKR